MVKCPKCSGEKSWRALLCPGARLVIVPCDHCRATGLVSEEKAGWWVARVPLTMARNRLGFTLRKCADELGVGISALQDAENGRTDPAALLARVEALWAADVNGGW